ncbi:hypothetical protein EWM64_g9419 [Hericium alpestre]|uniref:F-box domain-containing protein n=1 Tax=Hericium alpestre TaxID=135208 RepID=A0A4Y9ZJH0_9AGAM|nr:hypothetical protein EWM64_g9419 [Hericium alpestre]
MPFAALPIELVDAICHNVDQPGLVSLSRTSSSIHPVAQRLLYRHVSISRPARNLDVVITLARKPHVARFVRTFTLALDDSHSVFPAFYAALSDALASMTELTALDLLIAPSASSVLAHAMQRVAYPRLRRFTSAFSFDAPVADFLTRTPALEELELDSAPTPSTDPLPLLPPTAIPRLVHFVGSCQAAKVVVPGRPLESIHIHDGDLTEDEIACLAQSTGHVAVLGAITSALLVPLLQNIAHHLPCLAYLRVMAPFHADAKLVPDAVRDPPALRRSMLTLPQSFYEQVASSLRMMPELTDFEFSGMRWGSWQSNNDKENKPIWQAAPLDAMTTAMAAEQRDDLFDFSSDFAFVY